MQKSLENKINVMFWDLPHEARQKAVDEFIRDPVKAFGEEHILLRALNTLGWYELIRLSGGADNLLGFLDDKTINRLFPGSRRKYYYNAKRLLSKYIISPAE